MLLTSLNVEQGSATEPWMVCNYSYDDKMFETIWECRQINSIADEGTWDSLGC